MRTPLSTLVLLIGAAFAIALMAGCGDDSGDGADADPQEVLDKALGGDQQIDSGVLDLTFELTSEGGQGGSVNAALSGPFQSSGDGALPQLDLSASATGDSGGGAFDFEGGVTITSDAAFINYAGEDYAVDPATFELVRSSYQQSSELQNSQEAEGLQQFGIDPASWVTNLTNEGTEDLEGTEVIHIAGSGDIGRIVSDLSTVAEQTGQSSAENSAALSELESSVEEATIDVYANSSDETLRQLDLNLSLADSPGSSGPITVALSVGIADPNTEQVITAPANPRPIAELAAVAPGAADALGGVGVGPTGATAPPKTPQITDAYFDCVAKAQGPAEVEQCARLLGG